MQFQRFHKVNWNSYLSDLMLISDTVKNTGNDESIHSDPYSSLL